MRGILDENVTPQAAIALNTAGHDFWHVRDRGLTGHADWTIWRRAFDEGRILLTVNHQDFIVLAERSANHPGLVLIPPGLLIAEQRTLIMRFVDGAETLSLAGKVVELHESGGFALTPP